MVIGFHSCGAIIVGFDDPADCIADGFRGGAGDDRIIGGLERDDMTGGPGADAFAWNGNDFGVGLRTTADRITDFSQTDGDRIDLSLIDASTTPAGNDASTWIGPAAVSSVGGQLRCVQTGGITYVEGDRNGDRQADFAIRLDGLSALTAADFIL